jgi:hypothetical protein
MNPDGYHLASTIFLLVNGIWWGKNTPINLLIKTIFWSLGIWGVIICLIDFGLLTP